VDFPTLGKPTMPHFKLMMLIFPYQIAALEVPQDL